jgi:hypothetical protein
MKKVIQALTILALAGSQLYAQPNEPAPPPIPSQEEPEVLNEGPIHEAFAQPVDLNAPSGIVSPNEPPARINESPAMERPEGSQYVWIPGYWALNAERNEFLWVSGCWRVPPANMSWMPGYWNRTAGGWQWVAGFWTPTAEAAQIEYLPEPPQLTNAGPPASVDVGGEIWVPPCYYWRQNSYILRSGYWMPPRPNWIWTPSHYTWTPYGYVFVPGYWDRLLTTRGVLYAPVYFPRRFHRYPGYTYSLGVIVDLGNLQFSLFSYPRYYHYFFGDYYSNFYVGLGIYPWFEFERFHGWYDPIFVYDRWRYRRTTPGWAEHIRREYDRRRADRDLRPPRTYRELQTRISRLPTARINNYRMVEPLETYAGRRNAPIKFFRMTERQHSGLLSHAERVDHFRQERQRLETERRAPAEIHRPETPGARQQARPTQPRESERPGHGRTSPERRNFSRSPVTGRNPRGFFSFGRRIPSLPERERGIEHGESRSREFRGGGESRGGRESRGGGESRGGRGRR